MAATSASGSLGTSEKSSSQTAPTSPTPRTHFGYPSQSPFRFGSIPDAIGQGPRALENNGKHQAPRASDASPGAHRSRTDDCISSTSRSGSMVKREPREFGLSTAKGSLFSPMPTGLERLLLKRRIVGREDASISRKRKAHATQHMQAQLDAAQQDEANMRMRLQMADETMRDMFKQLQHMQASMCAAWDRQHDLELQLLYMKRQAAGRAGQRAPMNLPASLAQPEQQGHSNSI